MACFRTTFNYLLVTTGVFLFGKYSYPKQLALLPKYTFVSVLAFPENQTHELGINSTLFYSLSYRNAIDLF